MAVREAVDMSSVTLTDAQSAEIVGGSHPVALRNEHGEVLAVALSADEYRRYLYATALKATSMSEIDQARAEYRTLDGVSTDELFNRIGRLGIRGAGRS